MATQWEGLDFGNGTGAEGSGGVAIGTGMVEGACLLRTLFWCHVWVVNPMHNVPWANSSGVDVGYFQHTSNDHTEDETYAGNLELDWVWWERAPLIFRGAEPVGEQWNVRYEGFVRGDVQARRKAVSSGPTAVINWTSYGAPVGTDYDVSPFLVIGKIRNLWWTP